MWLFSDTETCVQLDVRARDYVNAAPSRKLVVITVQGKIHLDW